MRCRLLVAWATLAAGIVYFLLLEIEGRPDYGDFIGGPQIALLVLGLESARAALGAWWSGARPWAAWLAAGCFVAQLVFGLAFAVLEVWEPLAWH